MAGLSDGNEDELRDLIPRLTCPSASGTWLSSYCECVLQGVYAWLRRHPWQADCALAVVLLSFSAHQWADDPWAAVLSVLLAATVVPRQRYPVAAFAVAMALGGAQVVVGLGGAGQHAALQPNLTDLAIAVLLYTLAAWVLGDSVAYRYRRSYYASLEDRAARLEAERDAQVRIAAAAERARELQERRARAVDGSAARLRRIERDLHDGAQVRLTALAMTLGEIKENLDAAAGGIKENLGGQDDDGRTRMLVSAAHRNAKGLCRSPLCPGSVPLPAPRSAPLLGAALTSGLPECTLLTMLVEPIRDRLADRRAETRREIVDAAWRIARERGLAQLTLRDVAQSVGMRAPSLYSHFESKNAIYDAMFAAAWTQCLQVMRAAASSPPSSGRAAMRLYARTFFDFAVSDLARNQLMNQRTIVGFEPSATSYAPAVATLEVLRSGLAGYGVTRTEDVDLYVAIVGGLIDAQLANDPGGDRWSRLLERAIDMLADNIGVNT